MSIHIQIERFEGPLALLLHLIRKEEMDILDINIHHITRQYLEYIKVMKQFDLETAGEFIAMSATLIHIKSKMLLPQYDEDGEEIETEDPRKELVQKLLEYQKFKEASEKLYDRPLLGRDTWKRGVRMDLSSPKTEEEIVMEEDNALFALIKSYRSAVKNMKKAVHKVANELQSISERILELKNKLIIGQTVYFQKLISAEGEKYSGQVLITFLSMLELAKLGFVNLFQADNFSDIHVKTLNAIGGDVIAKAGADFEGDYNENEVFDPQIDLDMEDSTAMPVSTQEDTQMSLAVNDEEASETVVETVEPEGDAHFRDEAATDDEILREEELLNIKTTDFEGGL